MLLSLKDEESCQCCVDLLHGGHFPTPDTSERGRGATAVSHTLGLSNLQIVNGQRQGEGLGQSFMLDATHTHPSEGECGDAPAPSTETALVDAPTGYSELPVCPACLDRLDSTATGLVPCSGLNQSWQSLRCRLCLLLKCNYVANSTTPSPLPSPVSSPRHSHLSVNNPSLSPMNPSTPAASPSPSLSPLVSFAAQSAECEKCRVKEKTSESLWACLLCAHVGCGRYHQRHSVVHFERTNHRFSIDLTNLCIWDYVKDGFVHRIGGQRWGYIEAIPREKDADFGLADEGEIQNFSQTKLRSISTYYDNLLAAQLQQQQQYFEKKLEQLDLDAKAENNSISSEIADAYTHNGRLRLEISQLEKHLKGLAKKNNTTQNALDAFLKDNQFLFDLNRSLLHDQQPQQPTADVGNDERKENKADKRYERAMMEKDRKIQSLRSEIDDIMAKIGGA